MAALFLYIHVARELHAYICVTLTYTPWAPWSIVDVFDDVEDKLYAFDLLFTEILDRHAPVKTFKARGKPNPCVTDNIRGLMKTRDDWRKKAKKTNDPLSWTAYRYFRQEVKREIRIAEKEFVDEQIQRNPNNTNNMELFSICEKQNHYNIPQI